MSQLDKAIKLLSKSTRTQNTMESLIDRCNMLFQENQELLAALQELLNGIAACPMTTEDWEHHLKQREQGARDAIKKARGT